MGPILTSRAKQTRDFWHGVDPDWWEENEGREDRCRQIRAAASENKGKCSRFYILSCNAANLVNHSSPSFWRLCLFMFTLFRRTGRRYSFAMDACTKIGTFDFFLFFLAESKDSSHQPNRAVNISNKWSNVLEMHMSTKPGQDYLG